MQVQEGSIDSSHVGILHLDTLAVTDPRPRAVGSFEFAGQPWDTGIAPSWRRLGGLGWPSADNGPKIEVEHTPFGFHYAALRDADEPGKQYVRVTAFVIPYTAFIAGTNGSVIVVPRDDTSCSLILASRMPAGANGRNTGSMSNGIDPSVWGPEPGNRRLRIPPQDREAMASGRSFAGYRGGNRIQDAAVQVSEGTIYDRRKEHLVPADLAIIRMRRLLTDSMKLMEEGKQPLGLGEGYDFSNVRGAAAVVDVGTRWQDLVPGNLGEPAQQAVVDDVP
jgi:hypothetical protein